MCYIDEQKTREISITSPLTCFVDLFEEHEIAHYSINSW